MFEGVDDIKWEQFGDSHIAIGVKTFEIPRLIRNMVSDDQHEREWSIGDLFGSQQHLGMLANATPYIIPYALKVLAIPDYDQRDYLLFGLACMFDHMVHSGSFDYLRLVLQIYDEIKKGYTLYKRFLSDSEKLVRQHAVHIIGFMQDNCTDALSSLLSHLTVETDTEVRLETIKAILKLVKDSVSPYSDEGIQTIISLYNYLKENGSFEDQIQFARILKEIHFDHYRYEDIGAFMQQTLKRADAMGK